MNLFHHLTWNSMKKTKARTLVTVLGIILSTAMFTAVTTLGISFLSYFLEGEKAANGDYFISFEQVTMDEIEEIGNEEAVREQGTLKTLGYVDEKAEVSQNIGTQSYELSAGTEQFYRMMPLHLERGRLPQKDGEVVVPSDFQKMRTAKGEVCQIGKPIRLTLDREDRREPEGERSEGSEQNRKEPEWKEYTVVGIAEMVNFAPLDMNRIFTFDSGEEEGLWATSFVKTDSWDAYTFADRSDYGKHTSVNSRLINFYGTTKYQSVNQLIYRFILILMVIIMVGSVSLIYNAFSISVSERTRQFGLLSSVGATRKQIRRCVFREAAYLSIAGIPIGLLSGYFGIAVTLYLTRDLTGGLLWSPGESEIVLKAVPSFAAFAAAATVALATVLISAWIPARKTAKITPIAAIRETEDYKVPKMSPRIGAMTGKLFGLPGTLARKYYTVNRKKYRATVISLVISMALFVSAGSFIQSLNEVVLTEAPVRNYDFEVMLDGNEDAEAIRSHPAVRDSVILCEDYHSAMIPRKAFHEEYQKNWDRVAENLGTDQSIEKKEVWTAYLEDQVLENYLEKQNLDPKPYLDAVSPTALVQSAQLSIFEANRNGRVTDREQHDCQVLDTSTDRITLLPNHIPQGVQKRLGGEVLLSAYRLDENGVLIAQMVPSGEPSNGETEAQQAPEAELRWSNDQKSVEYYLRNPETGKAEPVPVDKVSLEALQVPVGASVKTLPLGVPKVTDHTTLRLILPLSSKNIGTNDLVFMRVKVSDLPSFVDFLEKNQYEYNDYVSGEQNNRNYVMMIRIFSYGFITLISLICICNVVNTISTNIALRRRDFGMLSSIGMQKKELYGMVSYECLQYGLKAVLLGVPISLLCVYLIGLTTGVLQFPIRELAVSIVSIFLVVFVTMFYAVSKVKKQKLIETIRTDG